MRWVILLIVAGCAHHHARSPSLVLGGHPAYDGVPWYLRCAEPRVFDTPPCSHRLVAQRTTGLLGGTDYSVGGGVRSSLPPMTRAQRLDKLRAVLAAIDAHVAALADVPTQEQRTILKMSVVELRQLLDAWPDVIPEAEELAMLVDRLGTALPLEQPALKKRMNQLADLIRVQVVLGAD